MSPEIALVLRAALVLLMVLWIERGMRRRAARLRRPLPVRWQKALEITYGQQAETASHNAPRREKEV